MIYDRAIIMCNRGSGAGGTSTTYYGREFEELTNNEQQLLNMGYIQLAITKQKNKYNYYLSKIYEDKTVVYLIQNGFKVYMKNTYNIDVFRCPDEAYIIEYTNGRKIVKILEKKEQRVEGSIETKLWSGVALKREYELVLGTTFEVNYGYCVNDFLKKKLVSTTKKYTILNTILTENSITVLFGNDTDYFTTLNNWINSS